MLAAALNIIFLHLWIVFVRFGMEHDIHNDQVMVCILVADVSWLLVALLRRRSRPSLSEFSVNLAEVRAFYVFTVIVFVVCAIYIANVGMSIFAEDVEWARHTAKKGYGYYNIFITRGALLAALYSFVLYKAGAIPGKNALLVIAAVIFLQVVTGFRTYVMTTLLTLWFCSVILGGRYSLSRFILSGLLALMIFSGITAYKYHLTEGESWLGVIENLWPYLAHRIFLEIPRVTGRILDLIHIEGVQYGMTYWWDFTSALPGKGYSLGDKLFLAFATNQEIAGIAPITPGLLGETVMNFGVPGIPPLIFLVYMLYRRVDTIQLANMNAVAVKSALCILLAEIIHIGLMGVMVSRVLPLLVFALFFLVIVYLLQQWERIIKILVRRRRRSRRFIPAHQRRR